MMRTNIITPALLLASAITASAAWAADPTFVDIAGQVGLAATLPSQGDQPTFIYQGKLALVPSRHGGTWPVMINEGGAFRQVASILPDKEDGHGCTAVDVTNPEHDQVWTVWST